MDINQQKEQFSITYIRAIAAVAGYSFVTIEIPLKYPVVISLRPYHSKPSLNALVLEICHESYH